MTTYDAAVPPNLSTIVAKTINVVRRSPNTSLI